MHELSISGAIVDTALRHAGGRAVTQVDVRVGALRQVVPESLHFYFEIVSRDTACAGAALEVELVGGWMRCRACEREWDPAPRPLESGASTAARLGYASQDHEATALTLPAFRCPACGAPDAEILRGDELEVESIEVRDHPAAAAAATN